MEMDFFKRHHAHGSQQKEKEETSLFRADWPLKEESWERGPLLTCQSITLLGIFACYHPNSGNERNLSDSVAWSGMVLPQNTEGIQKKGAVNFPSKVEWGWEIGCQEPPCFGAVNYELRNRTSKG